jgi:hypothetical protein
VFVQIARTKMPHIFETPPSNDVRLSRSQVQSPASQSLRHRDISSLDGQSLRHCFRDGFPRLMSDRPCCQRTQPRVWKFLHGRIVPSRHSREYTELRLSSRRLAQQHAFLLTDFSLRTRQSRRLWWFSIAHIGSRFPLIADHEY